MNIYNTSNNMLPDPKWFIPAVVAFALLFFGIVRQCSGDSLTASWYSMESCLREGTSGIMANGKVLDDTKFTAASWDHPFGTKLKVTNLSNGRSVVVVVSDRGPARRLYKKGRVVDLSKAAFQSLSSLKKGIIPVSITKLN